MMSRDRKCDQPPNKPLSARSIKGIGYNRTCTAVLWAGAGTANI